MISLFRRLLCLCTLLVAGAASAASPLQEILSRVAKAYGTTAPATIVEKGTTTSFRRGDGTLLRLYRAPDRFRINIAYATGTETRALLGKEAWQQGMLANPTLRGAIALQTARIALPWNMLTRPANATDLGTTVTVDGKTLRAIEFSLEEHLKLVVEVDPESGYIVRSRGIQQLGGSTMEFATIYSDFRTTHGRIHAMREEHFAMGQHTGQSIIEEVEYPSTLPDSAFTR